MTTLMSSGVLSQGLPEVLRLLAARDQAGEPRAVGAARAWDALYQWRLFAFTLPTSTLFFRTTFAATSATA